MIVLHVFRCTLAAVLLGACFHVAPVLAQNAPITLDKSFEGRTVANFKNGFFFAPDDQDVPGTPAAFLFGPDGAVRQRVAFKREGMVVLQVAAVAPASDGSMVVSLAGMATTGHRVFELVWIDPEGRFLKSVRTSPFAAELLHQMPNGDIWAGGHELTPDITLQKGHDILRRYSRDGKVLQTCLNLDSFPSLRQMDGHPNWNAFLFGNESGVGFLSPRAMELIVAGPRNCGLRRSKLTLPEIGGEFTGADFLPDGSLVVSTQSRTTSGSEMGLYRWNAESSAWEKLPAPGSESGQPWRGRLLGADGAALWLSAGTGRVFRFEP
jgi:hypothetical protein